MPQFYAKDKFTRVISLLLLFKSVVHINILPRRAFADLGLCVETGPRRGFFSSVEALVDQKTTRIWREWLAQKARINEELLAGGSNNALHDTSDSGSDAVLWIDQNKIAGFKVHVKERKLKRDTPILLHKDEDQPVSYSLELQELLISTTHLMLAVERPSLETSEESGKAMVFGSFAVQSTQQTPINVDE